MSEPVAPGPLAGVVVIDCSTVLAGPYCTMLLGDLGADVVKVEPPAGDATRGWGPPWVGDGASRTAAYFLAVNRNKRSIRLDLRTEEGQGVLSRLLGRADVLVENFRAGAFARLGFDDATLTHLNSRLVHLAISGYGPTGPRATAPGYDFVVQAEGGIMSITGFPDDEGGRPTKVGIAIADVVTGLHGAVAVLAALAGRDRQTSPSAGLGQRIDASLLASTLALLINQAQNAFVTGRSPGRRGNAHPNIVPYEAFATSDGEIVVAVGSERQWSRLCEAIGLPELALDSRFATNGDRVEARGELRPILAGRFAGGTSSEWLGRLEAADVPCARINDVLGAIEAGGHAGGEAAGSATVDVEHGVLGSIRQVAPPFALSSTPATVRRPPPLLGEHSDEILAWADYSAAEISALRKAGAI